MEFENTPDEKKSQSGFKFRVKRNAFAKKNPMLRGGLNEQGKLDLLKEFDYMAEFSKTMDNRSKKLPIKKLIDIREGLIKECQNSYILKDNCKTLKPKKDNHKFLFEQS